MSNRFARVTEEVILRHKELAVEHHKTGKPGRSALETLFLYIVILLHSWETGLLDKKKFPKLCEIYGLNLKNSYRRLKTMRQKGWIDDTKNYIRPLLNHRSKDSNNSAIKGVTVTPNSETGSVTVTPNFNAEGVTVTPEKCNSYTKNGEKGVTVTPKNGKTSIPISDYDDSKTLLNLKTGLDSNNNGEKSDVVSSSSENNQSQFSIEECLRYVEIRIERGEKLETPHRLAKWLHQTGDMDAFISATLYPEQPAQIQQPATDNDLTEDLLILRDIKAMGDDVRELEHFYTPEVWARLMGELQNR